MVKVFRPQQCSKKNSFCSSWESGQCWNCVIWLESPNSKGRMQMRMMNYFFHVGWARWWRYGRFPWAGSLMWTPSQCCKPLLLSISNTINPVTARGWWYGRDLPTICDHRGCLHGLVYSWVLCQVSFKSEQGKDDTTFKNTFTSQLLIYHKMYRVIPSWPTFWKQNSFRLSLYGSWWTLSTFWQSCLTTYLLSFTGKPLRSWKYC